MRHRRRADLAGGEAFGGELGARHQPDGQREIRWCTDDLDESALKDVLDLVRNDIGNSYHRSQLVEQIAARIID